MSKKKTNKNLYQRGGSWYVSIIVDGHRIRRSFGSDKNAAVAVLSELEKKRSLIRMGELEGTEFKDMMRRKQKRTVAEVAADFMKDKATNNKANTQYDYQRMLENYVLPSFGSTRVDQITETLLIRWKSELLTERKLSSRTTNKILTLVAAIFKLAHRRKEIAENPMQHLDKCKTEKRKNNVLSIEQLKDVLSALPPHWQPIFTFMAYTGCRHNEAFALRWRDIKWSKNQIEISRGRARGREGTPKTQSSVRTIPILPPVRAALEQLRADLTVINPDGHVFLSPRDKKPFNDTKSFNDAWHAALRKLGFDACRSYELRHCFASNMLERGVPINYVSSVLGHADLSTTLRAYASVINATNDRNHALMASIIEDKTEPSVDEPDTKHATG